MEMVGEQRLRLKMKFLLGYNIRIVVLWVLLVGGDYSRNDRMMEFQ